MIAVDASGRKFVGADAFPPILAELRGGLLLRWPWWVPGGRALARVVYGWVARHRHSLPGGGGACAKPPAE